MCEGLQELLWICDLVECLGYKQPRPLRMLQDNRSAIIVANHPAQHQKTKHIALRYHKVRENVNAENITIEYCPTEDMLADMLTKPLPAPALNRFTELLNLNAMLKIFSLYFSLGAQ